MFKSSLIRILNYIQSLIWQFKKKQVYKNPISIFQMDNILRNDLIFGIAKDITEYRIKTTPDLGKKFVDIDIQSNKLIEEIIRRSYYIYTNENLKINKLFNKKEEIQARDVQHVLDIYKKASILPINFYEAPVFYYKGGLDLLPTSVLKTLYRKDFIDGGAFIGDSAYIFEKFYSPMKVYAFEPDYNNFNLMNQTIEKNNLKTIIPIKKGLSSTDSHVSFKSSGVFSLIDNQGNNTIETVSLDKFAIENELNVGLIKLDVEGYELNVLEGSKEIIKKFDPVLSIAIYHNGEQFFETLSKLKEINHKYQFIIRKLNPLSPILETVLIGWVP